MNKLLLSGLVVLCMNGCQPQQADDTPRSRPPLANDTTPSKPDAPQMRDRSTSDAENRPGEDPSRATAAADTAERANPSESKAANPPPEQVDKALAACERLPADKQAECRQKIKSATDRNDAERSEDPARR